VPKHTESLATLVRAIERPGRREAEADGDAFVMTVHLRDGRKQILRLEPAESKSGTPIYRISTRCAPASEKSYAWALQSNMALSHCAIGIATEDGDEFFEMVACLRADSATPEELKSAVKEVAFYGDWMEDQLTKQDQY
jgi:hypothetical protein